MVESRGRIYMWKEVKQRDAKVKSLIEVAVKIQSLFHLKMLSNLEMVLCS